MNWGVLTVVVLVFAALLPFLCAPGCDKELSAALHKHSDDWNQQEHQIKKAMNLIKTDSAKSKLLRDTRRLFLYSKGILANEKSFIRKDKFNDLLESPKFEAERARLNRILQSEETSIDFTNSEDTLFAKFVKNNPEWLPNSSFVVFRDHPLLAKKPHAYVERIQLSGLCYMHAPVVLQHYLVSCIVTYRFQCLIWQHI
jgi:hypothetical protein